MSDKTKNENAVPAEDTQKQAPELSNDDLSKAVGGAGDIYRNMDGIKGDTTKSGPEGWIEIFS